MQDETNFNPQPQAPGTNFDPANTQAQSVPNTGFPDTAQDFSYFDPSQAQEPQAQAPTADYYNTGDYSNYGGQPQETVAQDFYTQPNDAFQDPNIGIAPQTNLDPATQAAPEEQNTFTEQKTGNRKLLFIAVGAVVVLLIAAGSLVYLNINNNKSAKTDNNDTSQTAKTLIAAEPEEPVKVDNSITGGDNTPATKAKKNSDSKTNLDWNKKYFRSPSIDADGNCIVLETCGLDSDKERDGLSTLQEYQFATDPLNEDTDFDGVADGDEIFVYYSDPVNKDTDGDTYSDSEEIIACFDPNVASADNFSTSRLTAIGNNVSLKTLHEPTIKTMKAKGATQVDLNSKATVLAKCLKPASDISSSPQTNINVTNASTSK